MQVILNREVRQGNGRARVYVPAVGALLSLPFAVVVLFYDDALASMAALVAMVLFAECWLSPAISVLQLSLPPRLRGYSIAIIMATTTCMNATVLFLFGTGVARSVSRRMRSLRSSWIFCCSSAMRALRICMVSTISSRVR